MLFASPEFAVFLVAAFALHLLTTASTLAQRALSLVGSLLLGDAIFMLVARDAGDLCDPLGAALFARLTHAAVAPLSSRHLAGAAVFLACVALGFRRAEALASDRVQLPAGRGLSASLVALGLSVLVASRLGSLDGLSDGFARYGHLGVLALLGLAVGARWTSPGTHTARLIVLFLASAGFYHAWAAAMPGAYKYLLGLILATIALDHELALRIDASERAATRKALLVLSLVSNLGVLALFKYYDFAVASLAAALHAVGVKNALRPLALILPAGISFHTFQSLSYTLDVYQRRIKPTRSVLELATFVLFFPQLVAGPIVRADEFLPQLARGPEVLPDRAAEGLARIAAGLFKKLALADVLALTLVDRVFAQPSLYSGLEALLGVYGYAFQIYLDFSAYSDIAIGTASLFGYVLPENFRAPYASTDLQDFWRRWHITLSSWLRDYLYIPLGGSRGAPWRTYRNLMITMLLGGLWHGAAWTFIAWGALHGGGLAVTRFFQRIDDPTLARRMRLGATALAVVGVASLALTRHALHARAIPLVLLWCVATPAWASWTAHLSTGRPFARGVSVLLTLHYVLVAWVFFRAPGFSEASAVFAQIASGSVDVVNVPRAFVLALTVAVVSHALPEAVGQRAVALLTRLPPPLRAACMVAAMLALLHLARPMVVPFIYFQF